MASSPNSSKSLLLVDDNMDDENDSLHLDGEGNIKSAQPSSPVMLQKTPGICLTSENFKIVCELADFVCSLISTRESIRCFSDTNLRIYGQSIRPHWLGRHKSSSLPGSISLPIQTSTSWQSHVQKYESKLHRKIVKVLSTLTDSLDAEIVTAHTKNLAAVKELVQETSSGQKC